MPIENFFHTPIDHVVARVAARVDAGWTRVLEIGPGFHPFPKANILVEKPVRDRSIDYATRDRAGRGRAIHYLDVNSEPLPFADDEIDFVYCRHVVEDVANPGHLLREMSRVAKRGYVETPTPMIEWARHIDLPGKPCPWRGYAHHRHFVWADDDGLVIVPKYPLVEHMDFGPMEETITAILATGPIAWHTRHLWEGSIRFRMMEHEDGFRLGSEYERLIAATFEDSLRIEQAVWGELF